MARAVRAPAGPARALLSCLLLSLCAACAASPDPVPPTGQVMSYRELLCRNDPIACRPLVLPVAAIEDARSAVPEPAPPSHPPLPLPRRPSTAPALILGSGERLTPEAPEGD